MAALRRRQDWPLLQFLLPAPKSSELVPVGLNLSEEELFETALMRCSKEDWESYYNSYLAAKRRVEPEGPVQTGDTVIDDLDRQMYETYVLGVTNGKGSADH